MSGRSPDVLLVGLGSTLGLREAEDQLRGSLVRAGASVVLVRPERPAEVRTLMATDYRWARAARAAATAALIEHRSPGAVVYGTTTSALFWPRAGAIRFDAPARENRPGRHGLWQRPLEQRRLAAAPLLIPQSAAALASARTTNDSSVIVPVAVEPSGPAVDRDVAAVTYAADPEKKGLDRVLDAWKAARQEGEELIVAGLDAAPDGVEREGVSYAGRLAPADYRALLRRARVYVTAPRREDHGIGQLEALADGCRVVTTPAPGPYVALPLLEAGLGWVAPPHGLRAALRAALDDTDPGYAARALAAIAPFRQAEVDRVVASELLPALLSGR
ncbi:MAG: glycosyltransferase [Baekduia sp.]